MKKWLAFLTSVMLLVSMCATVVASADFPYNDDELVWDNILDIDPESVNSVSVKTLPTKLVYQKGEELDTSGLTLLVIYNESERIIISEGYTISGYDPQTLGKQTVTVTFLGKTTTFDVTVEGEPDNPDDPGEPGDPVEPAKNGWVKEDGKWAFYVDDVKVKNQWKKDSNGWCYLGADGYMATDKWIKDSQGWCYVGANGYCVTNTWKKDSKGWVYLGSNGAMLTNAWCKDSKGWCYVGADGYAVTNCWKSDSHGWIYLDKNGSMTKSKWIQDGGKWYYLDQNGYMVAGKTITIDGEKYTFNAKGVWVD